MEIETLLRTAPKKQRVGVFLEKMVELTTKAKLGLLLGTRLPENQTISIERLFGLSISRDIRHDGWFEDRDLVTNKEYLEAVVKHCAHADNLQDVEAFLEEMDDVTVSAEDPVVFIRSDLDQPFDVCMLFHDDKTKQTASAVRGLQICN